MAETVVVYCKIPNGFHLTVKDSAGVDHTIRVNGPANKKGQPSDVVVAYGHGATRIEKVFWEQWLKEHKELEPVKKGHIFAATTEAAGKATAKERKDMKTGFEGIDPKRPAPGLRPDDTMKKLLDKLPPQEDLG